MGVLVGERDVPADDWQARTVLGHQRRQPAGRELRAQRVFVVIDHLRVLPELGEGNGGAPHLYPGSYVEYVERTGHEAPGVHA